MKSKIYLLLLLIFIINSQITAQKEPKITIEKVTEKCKGQPFDKRVVVKVARFSVTATNNAGGEFGQELATMLTAAIQQTSCFRVMEMNKNRSDMTDEIANSQEGFTDGSGPEAGKMIGAQLVVTGEVTKFSQGESKTTIMGISGGGNTATVGFILKLLNPQTGEILFSKSISETGSTSGFKGMKLFGVETAGKVENKAVGDAMEKAIIRAVEIMVDEKDNIPMPAPMKAQATRKFSPSNCAMLKNGRGPKIMILIPEAQVQGTTVKRQQLDQRSQAAIDAEEKRQDRQVTRDVLTGIFGKKNNAPAANTANQPAPASKTSNAVFKNVVVEQSTAENEIIKKFIESGFRVIDPKIASKLKAEVDSMGGDDLAKMASLGLKMGANIIITGVAVSEPVSNENSMFSFRGRIELRAITTDDASILASNTIQAGGIDVSESVAAKMALKNASDKMSLYMLEQLCMRNLSFGGDSGGGGSASNSLAGNINKPTGPQLNTTEVEFSNVTFAKMQNIVTYLKTNAKLKEVRKTFSGTSGKVSIDHSTSTDQIADFLSSCKSIALEIVNLEDSRIEVNVK
jgi:curli biogenesis system outer membrane secretion channel CsgG